MEQIRSYFLSLGSNIAPERHLVEAIRRLREFGEVSDISSAWQSHAVGSDGPDFLNVCVRFAIPLTAADVKRSVVDAIESGLGRKRTGDKYAPRTIDIDILFYGRQVISRPGLTIPHPRLHQRAFVLVPLADLAPDFVHPVLGKTAVEMLAEVDRAGVKAA